MSGSQPILTGKCACGVICYKVLDEKLEEGFGPCHCSTCRAWSGGVYFGMKVTKYEIIDPQNMLQCWKSSDWAERAFCKQCGSSLFYRLTGDGPMKGVAYFGAGTLDHWNNEDLKLGSEIFIDSKPKAYSFEGTHPKLTKEEFMKMFES